MILLISLCHAQNIHPFLNTIKIEQNDTYNDIIEKAAHVVPTPNQMTALQDEFIAFIHFGPNTFTRKEWGNGTEDPSVFDLKSLDTDQWCEALKAAGIKKVILTAKHHDGFVLWQSRYTKHGIMSTGFRNGKGDVMKDLSESCRKYNLKLGVYLSPADLYQIENPVGLYGNQSQYTNRTIPREIPERPFLNQTKFDFYADDYNEYFMNQLFELLTEYGPIYEVWFDGAHPKTKGGQKYNYSAWKKLIRTLAPEAVIFGMEDVRWCGNESGATRDTEWNVIPYAENPDTASSFPDMEAGDLGSREVLYKGKYLHYQQAETNTSIREGWFYRDDTYQKVRSVDDVFDIYERAVGGNSTFLLNIPPNREGKFSKIDVAVLEETGKRIRETYDTDLLRNAKGPNKVLDGCTDTYVILPKNGNIEIATLTPIKINRILIQEAIACKGERVEKHAVDVWQNGQWKEIASATNIGYKRILRFPAVQTTKIRIRVLESRLESAICNVSAHYYRTRAPQLDYSRNIQGMIKLFPRLQEFNWKKHNENAVQNLNSGYTIYYTENGSEPNKNSKKYEKPFWMDGGQLKAVAIINEMQGPILSEQIGFVQNNWQLLSVSDEQVGHSGNFAFDADPTTYWLAVGKKNHYITIDLKKDNIISGFAYTPAKGYPKGGLSHGVFQVSDDGKCWEDIEVFEFGNLKNDPSKRFWYLKKKVKAHYVRIKSLGDGNEGELAIAELDLF